MQITNSINSEVAGLVDHCELVKGLMNYLEFLYSGKGNVSGIYDVCQAFYRAENAVKSLIVHFHGIQETI